MPRDVFWKTPDGETVLQAWITFFDRDEATRLRYEAEFRRPGISSG